MKQVLTVRILVTTAWWWNWLYVPGVVTMALLGATPDWDKVNRVAAIAVRVRCVVDRQVLEA